MRLSQLALQPLDLVHLARGVRDAAGPQELEARVHAVALATTGASRDALVKIAFAETGLADATVAPMADALAVLDLVHQVLSSARPIDGRDALTASQPLPSGHRAFRDRRRRAQNAVRRARSPTPTTWSPTSARP